MIFSNCWDLCAFFYAEMLLKIQTCLLNVVLAIHPLACHTLFSLLYCASVILLLSLCSRKQKQKTYLSVRFNGPDLSWYSIVGNTVRYMTVIFVINYEHIHIMLNEFIKHYWDCYNCSWIFIAFIAIFIMHYGIINKFALKTVAIKNGSIAYSRVV